jgi:hypothetical protein
LWIPHWIMCADACHALRCGEHNYLPPLGAPPPDAPPLELPPARPAPPDEFPDPPLVPPVLPVLVPLGLEVPLPGLVVVFDCVPRFGLVPCVCCWFWTLPDGICVCRCWSIWDCD